MKFGIIFISIITFTFFQFVTANHQNQATKEVQQNIDALQEVNDNLDTFSQTIHIDEKEKKRYITEKANHFAHYIKKVAERLRQSANVGDPQNRQKIKRIADNLNQYSSNIRLSLGFGFGQMRDQLREQAENVANETEKMRQMVEEQVQKCNRSVNGGMKEAVDDLIKIIKRLDNDMGAGSRNYESLDSRMNKMANNTIKAIKHLNVSEGNILRDVNQNIDKYSDKLEQIAERISREAEDEEGTVKTTMLSLSDRLVKSSTYLQGAIQEDGKANVSHMKKALSTTIHNINQEVSTAYKTLKSNIKDSDMQAFLNDIMVETIDATGELKSQIEAQYKPPSQNEHEHIQSNHTKS